MAIKNRFYKTTQGVPFEFAAATTVPNVSVTADQHSSGLWTTIAAAAATPAAGDFYLLRQDPATGIVYAAKNNGNAQAFRTGTYKGYPHQLAWCNNSTTKQWILSSQFIPEKCDVIEKYTYAVATAQVSTITSSVIPVGAVQELYVKIIETTPGNLPLPVWDYVQQLNTTVTEQTAWTNIANKINYGSYSATSGTPKEDEWFTASAGTNSITITAAATSSNPLGYQSRTFKIVATLLPTKSDQTDYGVTFTFSTGTAQSSGTGVAAQVEDMYAEALVRNGIGHFYNNAGVLATEMGIPSTLAAAVGTNTYHIYKISGIKTEVSKTPMGVLSNKFYMFIASEVTDDATLQYPFGGSTNMFV
jgi:hypothetical protein